MGCITHATQGYAFGFFEITSRSSQSLQLNPTMNKFFSFIIAMLCSLTALSQNAYWDVRKLLMIKEKYASTLNNPDAQNQLTFKEANIIKNTKQFINSPFTDSVDLRFLQTENFSKLITTQTKLNEVAMSKGSTINANEAAAVDSRSNLKIFSTPMDKTAIPSKIMDATAQYLAKRSKEEMLGAFFDRFKEDIRKNEYLQMTFPTTHKLLNIQDGYSVPSMGKSWLYVFETDLKNVAFNAENLIKDKNPEMLRRTEGQLFTMMLSCSRLFSDKTPALDVMNFMEQRYGKDNPDAFEISNSVKFTTLLAKNLQISNKKDQTWASPDSLELLGEEGKMLYWGLLYQRNKAVFKKLGIKPTNDNIQNFIAISTNMSSLLNDLQSNSKTEDDTKIEHWLVSAQTMLDIVELGFKARFLIEGNPDDYYKSKLYQEKMSLPRNTLNIFRLSKERQYGMALLGTMEILNTLLPQKDSDDKNRTKFQRLVFYANFMSDVVTADNSFMMAQIIERYALPSGSYRIKRSVPFSVDINAYPGIFGALEVINRDVLAARQSNSFVHGITTPIGLSVNVRSKKTGKQSDAISLFVPVMDVGAAFSYRWEKGPGGGLPHKFKMSQFFSPGAYLVWNIRKAPASVMLGVQYTPQLRSVQNLQTGNLSETNALRIGFNICMDLPLFNVYR